MIARLALPGLMLIALAVSLSPGQVLEIHRKSFLGEAPPELVADKDHWLGKSPSISLAKLKGKVVWLQFNF